MGKVYCSLMCLILTLRKNMKRICVLLLSSIKINLADGNGPNLPEPNLAELRRVLSGVALNGSRDKWE